MSDLQSLIQRLEAASEGSRELDLAIRLSVAPETVIEGFWPAFAPENVPHYSTSLDAALTLVPESWEEARLQINWAGQLPSCNAIVVKDTFDTEAGVEVSSKHSPALALVIAALKARAAQ